MRAFAIVSTVVLVAGAVALAGCFGAGRGSGNSGPEYEGEFREFDLYLHYLRTTGSSGGWELYPDARVDAWAFSLDQNTPAAASVPGPTIRVRQGDTVRVNFYSLSAPMAHTVHWHGIHLPWGQDGVPYVSQLPVGDKAFGGVGNTITYEFQVNQTGTYWYHCHVDTAHHLDMGMYGALIVDPANPRDDPKFDAEETLVLDEWDRSHAHANPDAIRYAISRSGDPGVTANDLYGFIRDYLVMNGPYNDTADGIEGANGAGSNTPGLRETRDWYPITYAPYFAEYDTFMINGKAFPDTKPILVKSGQTIRLRIINAGSEVHALHLHGHHMYVTHKDGYRVPTLASHDDPYSVDSHEEFQRTTQAMDTILIAPGERYDAYVILDNPGPWMIHDHIALNEANDYISPGGMMTMLCYEDGWEKAQDCHAGHLKIHGGGEYTSGDVLRSTYNLLRTEYAVEQVKNGGSSTSGAQLPTLHHH